MHAPYIAAIAELKRRRNAVVLAHNYQTPEIFHGVADITGDSLALAREAAKTDADVIVLGGVHFMAETAKMLSPEKTVLIPDRAAGCSLAASITGADVRLLRGALPRRAGGHLRQHLGRGEGGVGHLLHVGERGRGGRVARRADASSSCPTSTSASTWPSQTDVEIILWKGHCEVHERFTGDEHPRLRASRPGGARARPSRVPARRARRGRLRGLDRRHDPAIVGDAAARRGGDGHRVLDERQRRRRAPARSSSCGPATSART